MKKYLKNKFQVTNFFKGMNLFFQRYETPNFGYEKKSQA
jgi:hypothetical protein